MVFRSSVRSSVRSFVRPFVRKCGTKTSTVTPIFYCAIRKRSWKYDAFSDRLPFRSVLFKSSLSSWWSVGAFDPIFQPSFKYCVGLWGEASGLGYGRKKRVLKSKCDQGRLQGELLSSKQFNHVFIIFPVLTINCNWPVALVICHSKRVFEWFLVEN